MSWSSASTSRQTVPPGGGCPDVARPGGVVTTELGTSLLFRRAGGPVGRARGLHAHPGLLGCDDAGGDDEDEDPVGDLPAALWLGRTPQVHTVGLASPIAVLTAGVTHRGTTRGRPGALRVQRVELLSPGRVGRWSWPPPVTLELHPSVPDRLKLAEGSLLDVHWGVPNNTGAL